MPRAFIIFNRLIREVFFLEKEVKRELAKVISVSIIDCILVLLVPILFIIFLFLLNFDILSSVIPFPL